MQIVKIIQNDFDYNEIKKYCHFRKSYFDVHKTNFKK